MKIIHVYAKNLQIFIDAVDGTDYHLNASRNIDYLINSLSSFNPRDILGLIMFANPITKKCLKLVRRFDDYNYFSSRPIILISDNIQEVWNAGYFKVRHSKVYLVQSIENSISDVDLARIFTTIIASSDLCYDFSICPALNKNPEQTKINDRMEMSQSLKDLLDTLEGGD